ncbi:MAG: transcription antitermination factor NusB [Proteobacteria bacterium]|nr:MAG: transcription antitermination factor NusB [Pseudomonadota bacterium]
MHKIKLSPRRVSRSLAVQGLYHLQTNPKSVNEIEDFLHGANEELYVRANYELLHSLLDVGSNNFERLLALYKEFSVRPLDEVQRVECSILVIAAAELETSLSVPAAVVINEAIELAKLYGGEDSFKFVNGLVDKMAWKLRPDEMLNSRNK